METQPLSESGHTGSLAYKASLGRFIEKAVRLLCFLAALVSVLTTAGILFVLLNDAFRFLREVAGPDKFFFGTVWQPNAMEPKFGVLPLVTGTLMITLGSLVISVPLGLFSAVYLSEYAPYKVKQFLKPGGVVVAMVKPQFEVASHQTDKGVVRDEALRQWAVETVQEAAIAHGFAPGGVVPAGVKGPKGNQEYMLLLR